MEKGRGKPWNFHACRECPYKSKSGFVMYKHARLHGRSTDETFMCNSQTPEMYDCGLCEFETDSKVASSEHFRVYHEEKKTSHMLGKILKCYKCQNCNFRTYSVLVMTKHVDNCDSDVRRSSKKSDDKIEAAVDYSDQWYEFNSEGAKRWSYYKCKHCPFQCTLLCNIKKHVKTSTHSNPNEPHFERCEYCSFKAKSKRELGKHLLDKHETADVWFECEQCSYMSQKERNLKNHVSKEHNRPSFRCEHCTYMSRKEDKLKQHVLKKHTKQVYKCEHCSYTSSRKENFKHHVYNKHTPSKTLFKCEHEDCSYSSPNKNYLRHHVLSRHTFPKTLFKCERCSFTTRNKKYYRHHVLHRHTKSSETSVDNAHSKLPVI